jgi:hypothetical protein
VPDESVAVPEPAPAPAPAPKPAPQPAQAPSRGQAQACQDKIPDGTAPKRLPPATERCLRSQNSNSSTTLRVVNAGDGPQITVYWLDYNGKRVKYGTVARGQEVVLQTYVTHPWVIAGPGDTALFVVLPGAKPGTVTVT